MLPVATAFANCSAGWRMQRAGGGNAGAHVQVEGADSANVQAGAGEARLASVLRWWHRLCRAASTNPGAQQARRRSGAQRPGCTNEITGAERAMRRRLFNMADAQDAGGHCKESRLRLVCVRNGPLWDHPQIVQGMSFGIPNLISGKIFFDLLGAPLE